MALCAFCKVEETMLYEGGVPICLMCTEEREAKSKPRASEHQVLSVLQQDLLTATERVKAATETFDAVTSEVPSGIPHPDSMQRIHNASRAVSVARLELMRAHNRLNDYLGRGIVPDDLKRGRGF